MKSSPCLNLRAIIAAAASAGILSAMLLGSSPATASVPAAAISAGVAVGAAPAPASAATGPAAMPSATEWVHVQSPNGTSQNILRAVSSLAPNDVWAVGQSGGSALVTLTMHWDGTRWTRIPSPNVGNLGSNLTGVAALSTTDVWAVGYYSTGGGVSQTLIEHWNGSAWSVVSSPVVLGGSSLNAVTAVSPNEVWAVGNQAVGAPGPSVGTLIMHWNGSSWETAPSPNVGNSRNDLRAVTAISSNDVWAVGSSRDVSEAFQTLIEHWNGSSWSLVMGPSTTYDAQLYAVAGVSSNDVWASGVESDSSGNARPHFLHYTGSGWSRVPSPGGVVPCIGCYGGLTAVAANDVWAAGGTFAHWDGTAWSLVAGAAIPGGLSIIPTAIDGLSSTDIWAVGSYNDNYVMVTLTEHWQETQLVTTTPTPGITSTSTRTPAAGTTTPAPSVTASTTPSACSIQFSDVLPGSTFYSYVQCLACRDVISGYSDGTFRPQNSITRGQAAKITANAAGYSETIPSSRQTFTDVPPGSTFWVYIERVALHGAIGGYSDGTFGPQNNVTRGQLAKIDSEVKGYSDVIPPTRQTFSDVPSRSTFWAYIERVALHNVVSGYPDGSFQPANDVTRGQASKIVSLTFFPECSARGSAGR